MPFVQLPLSLVTPRTSEIGSPLAHQLGEYFLAPAATTQEGIQTQVDVCLALAAGAPFDPHERIVFPLGASAADRGEGLPPTLLHAVLTLGCLVPPKTRIWPTELADFVSLPVDPDESPVERLAAVLVAAGCSPWTVDPDYSDLIPRELRLAAKNDMSGLLARFLETPDAWPIQTAANSPMLVEGKQNDRKSLLKWLAAQENTSCLDLLLARGARPWEPASTFLLDASLPAAKVLKKYGIQPSFSNWKTFAVQWQQQIHNDLRVDDVEAMARLWWGNTIPHQVSASTLLIGHSLRDGWDPSNRMLPGENLAARQLQAKTLVGRDAFIGKGLEGEWSALAAAAFSFILISQQSGGLRWSVNTMADVPPAPGSLSTALGFDWRPGIPVDGLLAMALFGQCRQAVGAEAEAVKDDWELFAKATGLADVYAWGHKHLGAAAAATLEFTSCDEPSWRRHKAGFLLTGVWATWLFRIGPDSARDALDASVRADVLMGLAPGVAQEPTRYMGMGAHEATGIEELTTVTASFFPDLLPKLSTQLARTEEEIQLKCDALTDPTLSGPALRALLAHTWASQSGNSTAGLRMTHALSKLTDWPVELIADLRRLWKSRPLENQVEIEAILMQRKLDQTLPSLGAQTIKGQKPRF